MDVGLDLEDRWLWRHFPLSFVKKSCLMRRKCDIHWSCVSTQRKKPRTMTQVYKLESHQISFCTKCILGNKIDRKFFPVQADHWPASHSTMLQSHQTMSGENVFIYFFNAIYTIQWFYLHIFVFVPKSQLILTHHQRNTITELTIINPYTLNHPAPHHHFCSGAIEASSS